MIGRNKMNFNKATMMQIVQEYLNARMAFAPNVVDIHYKATAAGPFEITVEGRAPKEDTK